MPATGFSPIQLFHSSTSGTLPTTSQLFTGEVFWNIADNKVYGLNTGGTELQTIVGSLGNQNASTVAITGGSINGTLIGNTTPSTGVFTTLVANTSVLSPIVGAGTGSNLSLQANATTWATLFQSGGLSLGNTTDPGAGNLSVSGNIITTKTFINNATSSTFTIDTSGNTNTYANGSTVNFSNFSGMILINNTTTGSTSLYLVGGGNVNLVAGSSTAEGSVTYNSSINGYTWTNNTGSSLVASFATIRLRSGA